MPINIEELSSDLESYLPKKGNMLSKEELTTIAENIVANRIPEDDEQYYSEALCKSLKAAAIFNNSRYLIDGGNLVEEKVAGVTYKYSLTNSKNIWKDYIKDLPNLCPYLPKGGYNMPQAMGIVIKTGDIIKVNSCSDYYLDKLKL
jgi:hypothetical protein